MRYLLDTHILLWWLGEPEKLTPETLEVIASKDNFVVISAASIWEMRIKQNLGKLTLPDNFEEILSDEPFERLSITVAHAHAIKDLPTIHRDPFDRILIAQAKLENLTLITEDQLLKEYEVDCHLNLKGTVKL